MPARMLLSSSRTVLRLALPATLRTSVTPVPCSCQLRSYAKGKGKVNRRSHDDDPAVEVPVIQTKGKKGKGKKEDENSVVGDASIPGEQFDLRLLEDNMKHSIDRLRVNLNKLVAQVGRVRPDLLDGVRVQFEGDSRPIREFANVTAKEGKELIVTCYDETYTKAVTAAIQASSLGLNPQAAGATTLKVPVPKADWQKRQSLVREASNLCENARVSIRAARHQGQKEIKHDVDSKVVGKDEGRSELKKLDAATKAKSDEVDQVLQQVEKVLMDES